LGARAPLIPFEIDSTAEVEANAFFFEQGTLHAFEAWLGALTDLAAGVDHPLPWHVVIVGQSGQSVAGLARVAGQAGEHRDLAVGRDFATRDLLDHAINFLVVARRQGNLRAAAFVKQIKRVFQEMAMTKTRRHSDLTWQITLGLGGALIFLLAIEAARAGFNSDRFFLGWSDGVFGWHGSRFSEIGETTKISSRTGDCRFKSEIRGKVEIAEDERSISAMPAGSSFLAEERGCGEETFVFTASTDSAGTPTFNVKIDGNERNFDNEAQDRLATVLQRMFRTGFDAEARVARLFRRGGAPAVIAEAREIASDGITKRYLESLFNQEISEADRIEALRVAGENLSGDYELAELLIALPPGQSPPVWHAALDASAEISSDFDMRRTLVELFKDFPVGDEDLTDHLLRVGEEVSSDHDMGLLIEEYTRRWPAAQPAPAGLFRALESISSDHDLGVAIGEFFAQRDLARPTLERLIALAADEISSDHDLTELLIKLSRNQDKGESWPPAVDLALDSIGNRHDRERAEDALGL
jgi:hypothetical protein